MTASFVIELHDSLMDRSVEVVRAPKGLVREMMTLQVAPDFFDVIELRSVVRKPFNTEPVRPRLERGPCRLAGMDRAVVQDQEQAPFASYPLILVRGSPTTGKLKVDS